MTGLHTFFHNNKLHNPFCDDNMCCHLNGLCYRQKKMKLYGILVICLTKLILIMSYDVFTFFTAQDKCYADTQQNIHVPLSLNEALHSFINYNDGLFDYKLISYEKSEASDIFIKTYILTS